LDPDNPDEMSKLLTAWIVLSIPFASLNGQSQNESPANQPKTFYSSDFKWTIGIPDGFDHVDPSEWEKLQGRGLKAVEDTYGQEVVNQARTIFVFKSGNYNYLESNDQPYDVAVDGNYDESCKAVREIVYETFKNQIPNAKIDSASFIEKIDGLPFHALSVKIQFPNGMVMNAMLYSRLFNTREFSLNIMYTDEKAGKVMMDAWRNSRFEK
jgi:hypothetical protein